MTTELHVAYRIRKSENRFSSSEHVVTLPKTLLLALNQGRCEISGKQVITGIPALKSDVLDLDEVMENFKLAMQEVSRVYADSMNIIHYMHDKYYYEKSQMALIDTNPRINLAYGVAGLSIVADSLSAIKHAKVTVVRDETVCRKTLKLKVNSHIMEMMTTAWMYLPAKFRFISTHCSRNFQHIKMLSQR